MGKSFRIASVLVALPFLVGCRAGGLYYGFDVVNHTDSPVNVEIRNRQLPDDQVWISSDVEADSRLVYRERDRSQPDSDVYFRVTSKTCDAPLELNIHRWRPIQQIEVYKFDGQLTGKKPETKNTTAESDS